MRTYRVARLSFSVSLLALLAACGGGHARWNGARGYDGRGDYGYDLTASMRATRNFRYHASNNYPPPGPSSDPWGPYIEEAGRRFSIPGQWIRAVMHQESGGHLYNRNGNLTTSWCGAMGLMQIMPATYEGLRRRYNLGDDPYNPHDNIMAGAGYIKEMYNRFGSPAFLAAYNAGPDRTASYLAGNSSLPSETVNYMASITPHLGDQVPMSGPLSAYASASPQDRAYAGGGMTGSRYYGGGAYQTASYAPPAQPVGAESWRLEPGDRQPVSEVEAETAAEAQPVGANSWRLEEGDRQPVAQTPIDPTPQSPPPFRTASSAPARTTYTQPRYAPPTYTPQRYASNQYSPSQYNSAPDNGPASYGGQSNFQPQSEYRPLFSSAHASELPRYRPAMALRAVAAPDPRGGVWSIQVGAFPDAQTSREVARSARSHSMLLSATQPVVESVYRNGNTLYRARLRGLTANSATAACADITARGMACFTVPPGS